jgi:hypothetical protein
MQLQKVTIKILLFYLIKNNLTSKVSVCCERDCCVRSGTLEVFFDFYQFWGKLARGLSLKLIKIKE